MATEGVKISEMSELTDVNGTEYIPVVRDNANYKLSIENATKGKQDTLKSGTNIKTINGETLLEEGDIQVALPTNITDVSGTDVTQQIDVNKYYKFETVTTLNITFQSVSSTVLGEYMFEFTSGSTPTVLKLPETVKWIGSNVIEANKTYQVSIVNNLAVMGGA